MSYAEELGTMLHQFSEADDRPDMLIYTVGGFRFEGMIDVANDCFVMLDEGQTIATEHIVAFDFKH